MPINTSGTTTPTTTAVAADAQLRSWTAALDRLLPSGLYDRSAATSSSGEPLTRATLARVLRHPAPHVVHGPRRGQQRRLGLLHAELRHPDGRAGIARAAGRTTLLRSAQHDHRDLEALQHAYRRRLGPRARRRRPTDHGRLRRRPEAAPGGDGRPSRTGPGRIYPARSTPRSATNWRNRNNPSTAPDVWVFGARRCDSLRDTSNRAPRLAETTRSAFCNPAQRTSWSNASRDVPSDANPM